MFVDALVLDVQLAQRCTLEVMARNDRGGKVAAQRIIALMKLLGGLLPRSSLHELFFRDDDQRLTKIQHRFWRKSSKSQDAKGNLHKTLHSEMKELQMSVWRVPVHEVLEAGVRRRVPHSGVVHARLRLAAGAPQGRWKY